MLQTLLVLHNPLSVPMEDYMRLSHNRCFPLEIFIFLQMALPRPSWTTGIPIVFPYIFSALTIFIVHILGGMLCAATNHCIIEDNFMPRQLTLLFGHKKVKNSATPLGESPCNLGGSSNYIPG